MHLHARFRIHESPPHYYSKMVRQAEQKMSLLVNPRRDVHKYARDVIPKEIEAGKVSLIRKRSSSDPHNV